MLLLLLLLLLLQALAPFAALVPEPLLKLLPSALIPTIPPMTDNACVSVLSVGPAAAAATMQQRSQTSSSSGMSEQQQRALQLLAITEDPFGSYLVDPDTLDTVKQVNTSETNLTQVKTI
jgi:hypothetical protein